MVMVFRCGGRMGWCGGWWLWWCLGRDFLRGLVEVGAEVLLVVDLVFAGEVLLKGVLQE